MMKPKRSIEQSNDAVEAIDRLRLVVSELVTAIYRVDYTLSSIDGTISGLVPHGFDAIANAVDNVASNIEDLKTDE